MFCRLCVDECSDFTPIFKGEGLKKGISGLILMHLNMQLSDDGEYSTIICGKCFDTLCCFNIYYTAVEKAQAKWQMIFDFNEIGSKPFSEEQNNSEESSTGDADDSVLIKGENYEAHSKEISAKSECSAAQPEKIKKSQKSAAFDHLIASHTQLSCYVCNQNLKSFKHLKKHFQEDHKTLGYMVCCKRKFYQAADLADHINLHLNPKFFKCVQCDRCFSGRCSLDVHNKTFHKKSESETNNYKCKHCMGTFLTKTMLESHEKEVHIDAFKEKNNTHVCQDCEKCYPNESKLKAHRYNVHTKVYSRMCHLCGKIVRGNNALERHQLQHEGTKPKVQCEICGVELSTKGILKAHIISLHPEDSSETHVCNLCGKNAPNKRALKYHMNYVHKCERSHKCNLCDKSFKRSQTLKEHIATHTGDRLYECSYCTKTFKVRSNMYHHLKKKHPQEFEENRRNRTKLR